MADKEATVFVVDVARSMGKSHQGREQSDLDWSLQYVWDKVSTIVGTGRKTLMAGVIGVGTDDTKNEQAENDPSYSHISVLQPISQVLLSHLQQLPKLLKPSNTDKRDVLSGIILGVDLIMKHCKHLKYKKRLIVITNGIGGMDTDDIADTAAAIADQGIELVLLGVDFDDPEYGFKEEDKPPEKEQNERAFRKLVDSCGGIFGTMQEAIEGLARPQVKVTRPVPTYRGQLQLGDPENYDTAITIDVERYIKVQIRRPAAASSYAPRPDPQPEEASDAVKQQFDYQVSDPTAGNGKKMVSRDELAKGYEYGRTAVHISQSDENITKLETFSSYSIIGFIPVENVERYMLIDNASMLVAQKGNDKAALALSSFVHALYELESLAVARLVKKDMTEPAITLLSPLVEPDFECLIENILPFAEDIRTYRFPPLDKVLTVSGKTLKEHRNLPKQDLLDAMSDFVDSMSLVQDDEELMPMDDTFSPVLHTIEGAIKYRAVHPDESLPPKSDLLASYARQPPHLQEAAEPALARLIKAAEVKKVPPKAKGRKRYREAEKPLSGLDVNSLFKKDKRAKISPDNAIPDFKNLVSIDNEDAPTEEEIKQAVQQMSLLIQNVVKNSFGDKDYPRATEMLSVVRQEMLSLEFLDVYRDVIEGLKRKVKDGELGGDRMEWWWMVRQQKLGLIEKGEKGEGGQPVEEGVGEGEGRAFWSF